MRRVRSDVSHRIRRQPSIFTVRWFRIALGVGIALVIVLLVGPSVAGWFGSDLPRSLFLLVPWSAPAKTAQPQTVPPIPSLSSPAPQSPASGPPRGIATATSKSTTAPVESPSGTSGRAAAGGPSATSSPKTPPSTAPPSTTAAAPAKTPAREGAQGTAPADGTSARPAALTAPPSVYWVQVGAFLDHRNADRLVERLQGDGLSAATTSFEQTRVLYRVLLVGADGGRPTDDVVERARGLGHPVEATADGPAVTGLVPLRRAVETSHALKQQSLPVRLKQEVSSSTYRVVRVGSFATVGEADAALASLAAKGVEGVVVRER